MACCVLTNDLVDSFVGGGRGLGHKLSCGLWHCCGVGVDPGGGCL